MEKEEKKDVISQDERWQRRYDEMMGFMVEHHRRPSKNQLSERLLWNWWRQLWNWWRQQSKLMTRGELPAHRIERFNALMVVADMYRRKNQYK